MGHGSKAETISGPQPGRRRRLDKSEQAKTSVVVQVVSKNQAQDRNRDKNNKSGKHKPGTRESGIAKLVREKKELLAEMEQHKKDKLVLAKEVLRLKSIFQVPASWCVQD